MEKTTENKQFDTSTIEYLQMIQGAISRMSTSSAIFKGFSATIVAGISLISYSQQRASVILLSFIPVLVFAVLDTYYLRLERKMRYLYRLVRTAEHPCDYDLEFDVELKDYKEAKLRIRDLIKSPSIYIFYPVMILILAIVFVLKVKGVV